MLTAAAAADAPLFDCVRYVAQIMVLTDAAEVNDAMSDDMRDMFHIPIAFVSITMLMCIFVTLVLSGIQLGLGSMILIARRKQLERRATSRRLSKERRESKALARESKALAGGSGPHDLPPPGGFFGRSNTKEDDDAATSIQKRVRGRAARKEAEGGSEPPHDLPPPIPNPKPEPPPNSLALWA